MNMPMLVEILTISRQIHQHEYWTRKSLEAYHQSALQPLPAYAYVHSPFARRFHQVLTDRRSPRISW
jgi:phenylacetate-coenzyme A ligase PaaK-like adenylate-forming protein